MRQISVKWLSTLAPSQKLVCGGTPAIHPQLPGFLMDNEGWESMFWSCNIGNYYNEFLTESDLVRCIANFLIWRGFSSISVKHIVTRSMECEATSNAGYVGKDSELSENYTKCWIQVDSGCELR